MVESIRAQLAELQGPLKSLQGQLNQPQAKQVDVVALSRLCVFLDGLEEKLDKQIFQPDKALAVAKGKERSA